MFDRSAMPLRRWDLGEDYMGQDCGVPVPLDSNSDVAGLKWDRAPPLESQTDEPPRQKMESKIRFSTILPVSLGNSKNIISQITKN